MHAPRRLLAQILWSAADPARIHLGMQRPVSRGRSFCLIMIGDALFAAPTSPAKLSSRSLF